MLETPVETPVYLANTFIEWGKLLGVSDMRPLKLQKLLYLYYARHLYTKKSVPFAERFVAWEHGPVLQEIYHRFKGYGASPITELQKDFQGRICTLEGDTPVLREVFFRFGNKSARDLVDITHDGLPGKPYETAWKKAWKTSQAGVFLSMDNIRQDGEKLFDA